MRYPRPRQRALLALFAAALAAKTVPQWTRFQTTLKSPKPYDNPVQDVRVNVTLTAPSGRTHTTEAFLGRRAAVEDRWSPDELGVCRFRTTASDTANTGLHNIEGSFNATRWRPAVPEVV